MYGRQPAKGPDLVDVLEQEQDLAGVSVQDVQMGPPAGDAVLVQVAVVEEVDDAVLVEKKRVEIIFVGERDLHRFCSDKGLEESLAVVFATHVFWVSAAVRTSPLCWLVWPTQVTGKIVVDSCSYGVHGFFLAGLGNSREDAHSTHSTHDTRIVVLWRNELTNPKSCHNDGESPVTQSSMCLDDEQHFYVGYVASELALESVIHKAGLELFRNVEKNSRPFGKLREPFLGREEPRDFPR